MQWGNGIRSPAVTGTNFLLVLRLALDLADLQVGLALDQITAAGDAVVDCVSEHRVGVQVDGLGSTGKTMIDTPLELAPDTWAESLKSVERCTCGRAPGHCQGQGHCQLSTVPSHVFLREAHRAVLSPVH